MLASFDGLRLTCVAAAFSIAAFSIGTSLSPSPCCAGVPDPGEITVLPADNLQGPFVCPIAPDAVPASVLNITAIWNGSPIVNGSVAVLFTNAFHACPGAVLTGMTDSEGKVSIPVSGSGCVELIVSTCVIKINGVVVRSYLNLKSPDNDFNGEVNLADLIRFAAEFNGIETARCSDFNNDGECNLIDLSLFASAFLPRNHCP